MMPNETPADRAYYSTQFDRLYERLDEIRDELSGLRITCSQRHAHDCEVLSMIQGNGHPALAVRLDRIEQAEPRKDKSTTFWLAISAIVATSIHVCVDWLRK